MNNIREYAEKMPVNIKKIRERWIIEAKNEGGCNCTHVDLIDLLEFVKESMPELLR